MDEKYAYTGSYLLTDEILVGNDSIPMGKLVLSPTRTYMPVIKEYLVNIKMQSMELFIVQVVDKPRFQNLLREM